MYVVQLEVALMPGVKYITQKERSIFARLFSHQLFFIYVWEDDAVVTLKDI